MKKNGLVRQDCFKVGWNSFEKNQGFTITEKIVPSTISCLFKEKLGGQVKNAYKKKLNIAENFHCCYYPPYGTNDI